MQEYRKFTKHVGVVWVAQVLMSLRGLILIPVMTKTLGASVYGVYSVLMVTVNLLAPISLLGFETSLVRFVAGEKDHWRVREGYYSSLAVVLFSSLLFSLLVFAFSPDLADTVLRDPNAAGIIRIGSFLILLLAVDKINIEFFRATHRIFLYSFLQLAETLAEVALATVLVLEGMGLEAVIYSFLLIRLLLFVFTLAIIISEIGFSIPDFSLVWPYMALGLPLVSSNFFSWVLSSSDRYFIGFFLGASQVGIYSAAYGISTVISMLVSPLYTILFPTTSRLWEEKRLSDLRTHFSYTLKYSLMLIVPAFFGVSVLSSQVLVLMTTQEFASVSYMVVPVVALATIFYFSVHGIYSLVFTLVKKTYLVAVIMGFGGVVNIALNIILIPWLGIMGAALATLASFVFVGTASFVLSQQYFKFPIDVGFVLKSIVASAAMAAVLWAWHPMGVLRIFVSIPVGACIYFFILFLLGGFKTKELEFFRGFIDAAASKLLD